jgi:hypothetical protein
LGSNKNLPASSSDKHNNYVKALAAKIEKAKVELATKLSLQRLNMPAS